jgi:pimeloyl-ACP methyl ester carboxylesterase
MRKTLRTIPLLLLAAAILLVVNALLVRAQSGEASGHRLVPVGDGDLNVVESGPRDAPVLLLIHGTAGSTVWWDPVVPILDGTHLVVRVDLLGHGKSAKPVADYSIAAHARRIGDVLDKLGVSRAVVVGHSAGGSVATALCEQQRGRVAALVLIDTGPRPDAYIPQGIVSKVLPVPVVGELLWRLRTDGLVRGGLATAFTRKVSLPDEIVADVRGMTYRAFTETSRGFLAYLSQRALPARLAGLQLPVTVIFGTDDRRWRASSSADYRAIPNVQIELLQGVGHTPMFEDPERTGALLTAFAAHR